MEDIMKTLKTAICILSLSLLIPVLNGCGNDNNSALSPFQPEIINDADAFQFQVTDADNVTTVVSYTWQNSGTQATVNHSSVINSGSATVTVLDADQTQVYTSGLVASANEPTQAGTSGDWTIQVVLMECSGTLNFRVETFTP
jgi:hypothetical protein